MLNVATFPVPENVHAKIAELIASPQYGGGGNSEGMDGRIDRLEARMDKIDDRLRGAEHQLATLNERVVHLLSKGFIVNALLTGLSVMAALILFKEQILLIFK
jgi:hypothetical protein